MDSDIKDKNLSNKDVFKYISDFWPNFENIIK